MKGLITLTSSESKRLIAKGVTALPSVSILLDEVNIVTQTVHFVISPL